MMQTLKWYCLMLRNMELSILKNRKILFKKEKTHCKDSDSCERKGFENS